MKMDSSAKSVVESLIQITKSPPKKLIEDVIIEIMQTPITEDNMCFHHERVSLINTIYKSVKDVPPCDTCVKPEDGATVDKSVADDANQYCHYSCCIFDKNIAVKINNDYIMPCLIYISSSPDKTLKYSSFITELCELLEVICRGLPKSEGILFTSDVFKMCLNAVTAFNVNKVDTVSLAVTSNECPSNSQLPLPLVFNVCCKMFHYLLNVGFKSRMSDQCQNTIDLLQEKLMTLISYDSEKTIIRLCSVLASLIDLQPGKKDFILGQIWKAIENKEVKIHNSFAIICALANYFLQLPSRETKTVPDNSILNFTTFWKLIQSGIPNENSLTRKRSLYLLKRIVDNFEHCPSRVCGDCDVPLFWWDPSEQKGLLSLWQDFMLLVEMLEEKQIHVIKPLFPRLKLLQVASKVRNKGPPYLHASWLLTLFQRTKSHDSLFVMKWGMESLLETDCRQCPLFDQEQHEFFYGPFLEMLNESQFFARPTGVSLGSCPPTAANVATFLQHCLDVLADERQRCSFMKKFLLGVRDVSWNGVSLMFVSRAISEIRPTPLLDQECIQIIWDILFTLLTNTEVRSRGAIQCFFTKALFKLMRVNDVTPEDLISFLSVIKSDESYCRGSPLWMEGVKWMKSVATDSQGTWGKASLIDVLSKSLASRMKSTTISDLNSGRSATGEAKFLLLLMDTGIIPVSRTSGEASFEGVMFPVLDTLASAATRLYLPREKADEALNILVCLLKELGPRREIDGEDEVRLKIEKVLVPPRTGILDYMLLRIFSEIKDIIELPIQSLCLSGIELLSAFKPDAELCDQLATVVDTCVEKLVKQSKITMDVFIQSYGAIQALAMVCDSIRKLSSDNRSQHLLQPAESKIVNYVKNNKIVDCLPKLGEEKAESEIHSKVGPVSSSHTTDMGWMMSRYMMHQWEVMHFTMERAGVIDTGSVIDDCLGALDTGSEVVNLPIFRCLEVALPHVLLDGADSDVLARCVNVAWSSLLERPRGTLFWPAYDAFVKMCFQTPLLQAAEGTSLLDALMKICDEIFFHGEDRVGVVNVLISHFCTYLLQEDNMKYATKLIKQLTQAAVFGPIHKKNYRVVHDIFAYVSSVKEVQPAEDSVTSLYTSKEDYEVRLKVINFLSSLDPEKPYHSEFIKQFTAEIKRLQTDTMAQPKYRHFPNTLQHRQSQRLVSTLVLLEPYVKEEDAQSFLDFLTEKVLLNEVQPSVRYLTELTIVRIFSRFPATLPTLWQHLEQSYHMRPALMSSWLCILSQLVTVINGKEFVESFLFKAIPLVFPLCMAHQFNLRIFAQSTMLRIWVLCEEIGLTNILEKYQIMECIKKFHDTSGNSSKTSKKLLDHFLFKIHPQKDYSMKTIFETLPRLSDVIDEEWITPKMFLASGPMWSNPGSLRIPLFPDRDDLEHSLPGSWKMKVLDDDDDGAGTTEGDVQRKITPWRCMLPDDEVQVETTHMKLNKNTDGLVLVASLINKPPNLGGLCRTSEVFGVSQVVLGSLTYLKDPMFQSLSVTAEKWVSIKEVQPYALKLYLTEMRNKGYTLIGVEQTANSVCMTKFTFPEKSLLLLGNEKGGIPVELIQHLDICVEIPQQGVVRSLNVHVCGALLMWEYRRQQLLKVTE